MLLEKFPSIIALVTFFAVAATVSHEWGYFGVIGQDFQSLYTTHDYLELLIIGIGPSFIFLTIFAGIQIAALRSDDFQIKPIAPKSKWGRFIENWFLEIIWTFLFLSSLLFEDQTHRSAMYALLSLFAIRVVGYVLSWPGFSEYRRSPVSILALALPATLVFLYGAGRDNAYSDLKDTKDLHELKLKDQSASRNVKVLRLIDKGVILFDNTTRSVEFYPNENIALLRKQAPEWDTKSFACSHFGWKCKLETDKK